MPLALTPLGTTKLYFSPSNSRSTTSHFSELFHTWKF